MRRAIVADVRAPRSSARTGRGATAAPPHRGAAVRRAGDRRGALLLALLEPGQRVDTGHVEVAVPRRWRVLQPPARRAREVGPNGRVPLGPHAVVPERNRGQLLEDDLLDL